MGISLTYIRKSRGLKTEPCGLPAFNLTLSEILSLTLIDRVLSDINEDISLIIFVGRFIFFSLWRRPLLQTESNAFSTSMNIAAPTCFLARAVIASSARRRICSMAHLLLRFPICHWLRNSFESNSLLILFTIIFSNSLPMQLSRLIGL